MMNRAEKNEGITEVLTVKKTREYKIGVVLSGVALVLLCVALVAGLVNIDTSIERICFFLGVALNCLGFVFWNKSIEKNTIKNM